MIFALEIDLTDFFSHAFLVKVYRLNHWRVLTASRFLPSDWRAADVEVKRFSDDVLILTFHRVDEQTLRVSGL